MRILLVVTGIVGAATAAGAQPQKDEARTKAGPASSAPVMLASAGNVKQAPATDHAQQPVHRPAPRVTKCRCGDPQASVDQPPSDEQPDR